MGMFTITLDTKEDLDKFRAEMKEKNYREAGLIYRAGKYILTYLKLD